MLLLLGFRRARLLPGLPVFREFAALHGLAFLPAPGLLALGSIRAHTHAHDPLAISGALPALRDRVATFSRLSTGLFLGVVLAAFDRLTLRLVSAGGAAFGLGAALAICPHAALHRLAVLLVACVALSNRFFWIF